MHLSRLGHDITIVDNDNLKTTPQVYNRDVVVDERAGGEVGFGVALRLDGGPQAARIGRALGPAGKEGAAIGERERSRDVEADERFGGHLADDPVGDLGARPSVAGADHAGRGVARLADRERDARVALARGARPVDRGEVREAVRPHAPPRSLRNLAQ